MKLASCKPTDIGYHHISDFYHLLSYKEFFLTSFHVLHQHTGVSGQIEDQSGEEGEEHAGNDDVDDEIKRQPQHQEVIGDVQVRRVWTTGVVNPVFPVPVVL